MGFRGFYSDLMGYCMVIQWDINGIYPLVMTFTLRHGFSMALIEIDDFPAINLHLCWGFSMAMLVITKCNMIFWPLVFCEFMRLPIDDELSAQRPQSQAFATRKLLQFTRLRVMLIIYIYMIMYDHMRIVQNHSKPLIFIYTLW